MNKHKRSENPLTFLSKHTHTIATQRDRKRKWCVCFHQRGFEIPFSNTKGTCVCECRILCGEEAVYACDKCIDGISANQTKFSQEQIETFEKICHKNNNFWQIMAGSSSGSSGNSGSRRFETNFAVCASVSRVPHIT